MTITTPALHFTDQDRANAELLAIRLAELRQQHLALHWTKACWLIDNVTPGELELLATTVERAANRTFGRRWTRRRFFLNYDDPDNCKVCMAGAIQWASGRYGRTDASMRNTKTEVLPYRTTNLSEILYEVTTFITSAWVSLRTGYDSIPEYNDDGAKSSYEVRTLLFDLADALRWKAAERRAEA